MCLSVASEQVRWKHVAGMSRFLPTIKSAVTTTTHSHSLSHIMQHYNISAVYLSQIIFVTLLFSSLLKLMVLHISVSHKWPRLKLNTAL